MTRRPDLAQGIPKLRYRSIQAPAAGRGARERGFRMRVRPAFRLLPGSIVLLVTLLFGFPPAAAISCPSCDDLNFCTVDSCDTSTGTCRHDPNSCDDSNHCTVDSCTRFFDVSGICNHLNQPFGTL